MMRIGFDAKRAFHNSTGLGHYSRTLIQSLAQYFPQHEYFLFNPKPSTSFNLNQLQVKEILPGSILAKTFSGIWRSNWVVNDLKKYGIQLYHGLSHEIPFSIHRSSIKIVVTIHDLIHERYPHQYKAIDRAIYTRKYTYACKHAHAVIAISEQTKNDLIEFYQVPKEKIYVCYQSCNSAFGKRVSAEEQEQVRLRYNLPPQFFLSVGSIIERKNLLNVCKAYKQVQARVKIPLVVIGGGGLYKKQVIDYVNANGLSKHIIFLSDSPLAQVPEFKTAADFPAIYQMATAMLYPSFFEGFGIPVLEALWSRLPVITSNVSCLPEAGGDAAYYVDPASVEEIGNAFIQMCENTALVEDMRQKGWEHAQLFTQKNCATAVMNVYEKIMQA